MRCRRRSKSDIVRLHYAIKAPSHSKGVFREFIVVDDGSAAKRIMTPIFGVCTRRTKVLPAHLIAAMDVQKTTPSVFTNQRRC